MYPIFTTNTTNIYISYYEQQLIDYCIFFLLWTLLACKDVYIFTINTMYMYRYIYCFYEEWYLWNKKYTPLMMFVFTIINHNNIKCLPEIIAMDINSNRNDETNDDNKQPRNRWSPPIIRTGLIPNLSVKGTTIIAKMNYKIMIVFYSRQTCNCHS